MEVWVFLVKNITQKLASQYHSGALAVLAGIVKLKSAFSMVPIDCPKIKKKFLLQASKPYRGINFLYQHFSVDTTKLFQKALMLLKEQGTYNFKCCMSNLKLRLLSCHFNFCQCLDCNRRRDLRRTDTRWLVPLNTLTQPLVPDGEISK